MSDRLALANVIEDAGIPRAKAEEIATAIARFVEGNAATKADVERVGTALKMEISRVEAGQRFLQWQITVGFALVVAIAGPSLWLLLRVAAKLGALGG